MAKTIFLEKNDGHFEYFICNLSDDDKKKVSIANSTVARKAFQNVDSIEEVSFENCTKIEEFAFENCKDLKTVVWRKKQEEKSSNNENSEKIKGIAIADRIAQLTIQYSAFKNCVKLQTVILPNITGTITIEKDAFLNCYELRTVILLGNGTFEISTEAFSGCDKEKLVFICSKDSKVEQFARENGYRWVNVQ